MDDFYKGMIFACEKISSGVENFNHNIATVTGRKVDDIKVDQSFDMARTRLSKDPYALLEFFQSAADDIKIFNTFPAGARGLTAIAVCIKLGYSGSIGWVYDALDFLVEKGELKVGTLYTDSIFYVV